MRLGGSYFDCRFCFFTGRDSASVLATRQYTIIIRVIIRRTYYYYYYVLLTCVTIILCRGMFVYNRLYYFGIMRRFVIRMHNIL